uniref:Uncharacterized protein n=1 Tax=Rousettus aegyptiacus TaxID=9407 RepID=A0A7J8FJ55_ROUAE|nr:hypothetical protein HJG63_012029 [Rousettus aegyptiacus]
MTSSGVSYFSDLCKDQGQRRMPATGSRSPQRPSVRCAPSPRAPHLTVPPSPTLHLLAARFPGGNQRPRYIRRGGSGASETSWAASQAPPSAASSRRHLPPPRSRRSLHRAGTDALLGHPCARLCPQRRRVL